MSLIFAIALAFFAFGAGFVIGVLHALHQFDWWVGDEPVCEEVWMQQHDLVKTTIRLGGEPLIFVTEN